MEQDSRARLEQVLVHKRHDGDVVLGAHGGGNDRVVVVDDLLQCAHAEGIPADVVDLRAIRLFSYQREQ